MVFFAVLGVDMALVALLVAPETGFVVVGVALRAALCVGDAEGLRGVPCALSKALTASDSSLTRSLKRSTSEEVWTPSRAKARETRSSNTCSSLSHVPPAMVCISLALALAASRAASAVCAAALRVLASRTSPCLTSMSKTCFPPCCALANAPSPASQIWCEDSSTALEIPFSPPLGLWPPWASALAFLSILILLESTATSADLHALYARVLEKSF